VAEFWGYLLPPTAIWFAGNRIDREIDGTASRSDGRRVSRCLRQFCQLFRARIPGDGGESRLVGYAVSSRD
jgi:hypothetical protein